MPYDPEQLKADLAAEPCARQERTSALFRWMAEYQAEFEAILVAATPTWSTLATMFTRHGLSNGRGQPLTGERVRQTWYAVRKAAAENENLREQHLPQGVQQPAIVASMFSDAACSVGDCQPGLTSQGGANGSEITTDYVAMTKGEYRRFVELNFAAQEAQTTQAGREALLAEVVRASTARRAARDAIKAVTSDT